MYNINRLAEIPFSINTSYVIYWRSNNERPRINDPDNPNRKGRLGVYPKLAENYRKVGKTKQVILDAVFLSMR